MNVLIAAGIGIVGSSVVHVSKGLMKLGIRNRARTIHLIGVLLNFSAPLWIMIANLFAAPVVYASMYASGLLSLLLFSRIVLNEHLYPRQIAGAVLVAVGTAILAFAEYASQSPGISMSQRNPVLVLLVLWVSGSVVGTLAIRTFRLSAQEIWFGVAAGGFAALDAILKGMAQRTGELARFIPAAADAQVVLIGSFLVAALAFVFIQWSYIRHCRASTMGIAYDLSFVTVPVIVFALTIPGYQLTGTTVAGLTLLGFGAIMLVTGGHRV